MARKSSRSLWTAKLTGKPIPVPQSISGLKGKQQLRSPYEGIILGIDPSLRKTGFALVEFKWGHTPQLLESLTLKLKSTLHLSECLAAISAQVTELLHGCPCLVTQGHVAMEQTIYVQNFQTAQIMGAARGAAMAAAASYGLPVFEYPPLRVKQAVVGFGRASKEQVAKTVQQLVRAKELLPFDESDAIAVALCHGMTWRSV